MASKTAPKTAAQRDKHKTVPIPSSITPVPGYPNKLVIYKSEASPYWWARYYAGKTVRRSTKTENKAEAFKFAKKLYDEINHRIQTGLSVGRADKFTECVEAIYADQKAQVKRGALNPVTAKLSEYRFEKHILPHFKHAELSQINYFALQGFLNYLSGLPEKLSVNTIRIYMHLVRKVLTYAHRAEYIKAMPPFPVVGVVDNPRDYFTVHQYRDLRKLARQLRGKVYEIRKVIDEESGDEKTVYALERTIATGRVIHRVKFEHELYDMIVFMTNSFIRPSDIKTMQHKHVEKDTREGHTYLRLRLPATKGHDNPIVTLERAVRVYERLTRHYNKEEIKLQKQLAQQAKEFEEKERKRQERAAKKLLKNPIQTVRPTQREQKAIKKAENAAKKAKQQLPTLAAPDNYVFMPQYHSNRDHALKLIQRQFDVLLHLTGLRTGNLEQERSLYSLRHSCIMYRLMYGERMDLLTLARNARTSPEMIDRHYASKLTGEHNIAMIQSDRRRNKLIKGTNTNKAHQTEAAANGEDANDHKTRITD
jgi:hypothetical protein